MKTFGSLCAVVSLVTSVLRSTGAVSFSQALAEAAAKRWLLDSGAVGRGTDRLSCQLTNLAAGGKLQPTIGGAPNDYADESVGAARPDDIAAQECSSMHEAAGRVRAALLSSSALSRAELKQLRREVAMIVHPDRCSGEHKQVAEELMKSINALVAAALDGRTRP